MKIPLTFVFIALLMMSCSPDKQQNENTIANPESNLINDSSQNQLISAEKSIDNTTHSNQVSLKGIELGKIYEGQEVIETTVSDVKGVMAISALEDQRSYKIAFLTSHDLSEYEVASFKKNVEKNYNINFKQNSVKNNHYYEYVDNLYYSLIENELEDNKYSVSFSITDKNLMKLKNLKVSTDF